MKIFRYMKQNYKWALLALLLCIIVQIVSPIAAILEQKLIDYIIAGDTDSFLRILWYVAALVVVTAGAHYLYALAVNKYKAEYVEQLRNDLYGSIMRRDISHFNEQDTAEYISIIQNDVSTVAQNFTSPIWMLIGAGVSAVAALAIMIAYSPALAVVAVVCSGASFYVPIIITKHLKKLLVEKSVQEAALSVQLKEALSGHDVISAFGVLPTVSARFTNANSALTKCLFKLEKQISILENCSAVVGKAVRFITYFLAGVMAIQGKISIGTVLLFVSLYEYFSADIMLFSQIVPLLRSSLPILDKLMVIIKEKDDICTGWETPSFEYELCVNNLSFQYTQEVPVLKDLNMCIHKGEKVALIGPSGCGKSTLIKLLSGSYCGYTGQIFYDGAELKHLDSGKLKKLVTVIHQQTFIFNDTIRYNICLGEVFSEAELDRAVKLSGVEKFLPSIVGGIDGSCGEDGANLSGGQKQRIAIARALIRTTPFLILDEGTSALDAQTAEEIESELMAIPNLTVLTITHHLHNGEQYDQIISLPCCKAAV